MVGMSLKHCLQFADAFLKRLNERAPLVCVAVRYCEVVNAVVVAYAVQVVNVLVTLKRAADRVLHDYAVLVAASAVANIQADVSFRVNEASAAPESVVWPGWRRVVGLRAHRHSVVVQAVDNSSLRQSDRRGYLAGRQPAVVERNYSARWDWRSDIRNTVPSAPKPVINRIWAATEFGPERSSRGPSADACPKRIDSDWYRPALGAFAARRAAAVSSRAQFVVNGLPGHTERIGDCPSGFSTAEPRPYFVGRNCYNSWPSHMANYTTET